MPEAARERTEFLYEVGARMAEAFEPPEVGGDHFRSSAVFLTHVRPKQTKGSDLRCGTSMDQVYAQRIGRETAIPSLQLAIETLAARGTWQPFVA